MVWYFFSHFIDKIFPLRGVGIREKLNNNYTRALTTFKFVMIQKSQICIIYKHYYRPV